MSSRLVQIRRSGTGLPVPGPAADPTADAGYQSAIDRNVDFSAVFTDAGFWIVQGLNTLQLAMLLFLLSVGLSVIFGLLNFVNLAHGSLYLLGGYIGYEVGDATGWWILSFIVAFVVIVIFQNPIRQALAQFGRNPGGILGAVSAPLGVQVAECAPPPAVGQLLLPPASPGHLERHGGEKFFLRRK